MKGASQSTVDMDDGWHAVLSLPVFIQGQIFSGVCHVDFVLGCVNLQGPAHVGGVYAELSPFRQIFTGVVLGPHLQATKTPAALLAPPHTGQSFLTLQHTLNLPSLLIRHRTMLVTHPSQNVATRQASLTGRRRGRFHEFGQSFLLVVLGVVGMRNAIAFYSPFSLVVLRHAQLSTTAGIGGSTKWAAQNQATHTLLLKCGGLGFQMFFAHPSEPTPSSTFREFSTAWTTSSSDTFVQIGSHSDGDRFINVLFFRLRQLSVSSRPLPSDRDSCAEIAPCPASESSSASELILETSLAAAVRVGNAALCSCAPVRQDPPPTSIGHGTHGDLLLRREPWVHLFGF